MAQTGFRRFTSVGASSVSSGNVNDLTNTGTGAVRFQNEGHFVELTLARSSDALGTISGLSDDIPAGAKLTGLQFKYPLLFHATTMPTVTTRARVKLSDSNIGSWDVVTKDTTAPLVMREIGEDNNNFFGITIDPYNHSALNTLKFDFYLYDISGVGSLDMEVRLGGINFGDTLSSVNGPSPAVSVFYHAPKVVITNPTRVVLHNNKRAVIGHT
tara:strand:+ start:479 stop:1120 length:642 start_codon:yes stop_codon:yes gene_type:complete